MTGQRRAAVCVIGLAVLAITVATLTPDSANVDAIWQGCLVCGERPAADGIVNILLFVPLGIGLALAGVGGRRVWLVAVLLSSLVELGQLVLPGRYPTFTDIAFNAVGAAAGAALWRGLGPGAWAWRMIRAGSGLVGAMAVCLAVAGTAWLLGPSLPSTRYWGQWTPYFANVERWYRGRVIGSEVGNVSVRSRRIPESGAVRAALRAGEPIVIEAVAGPPARELAPLFAIADEDRREIAFVGVDAEDVLFRRRARAAPYGLDQPGIRLRGAMSGLRPGDSLRVQVRREGRGRWCLSVNHRTACDRGYSAAQGWALLYSGDDFPDWMRKSLNLLWMAALVAPVGLGLRPNRRGLAALALVVLALVAGSRAGALLVPRPLEWTGVALGLAAGVLVAHLAVRPPASGR